MRITAALLCLTYLTISVSYACFTGGGNAKPLTAAQKKHAHELWLKNLQKSRSLASDLASIPWGGDEANWSNEAVMANAVSSALNEGWAMPDVQDVLVAIPVKMVPGKVPNPADKPNFVVNRPYGDGQTNAHVSFGDGWNEKRPELVATLVQFKSSTPLIRFHFHFSQPQKASFIEIKYQTKGGLADQIVSDPVALANGDLQWEWKPSSKQQPIWGSLFDSQVAFVRLAKASTWFPIDFRNVEMANQDLLASIPEELRHYGKGTLDPEGVRALSQKDHLIPYQEMDPNTFASDLQARRFYPVDPPGIHSGFYDDQGNRLDTAVGDGDTTLFDRVQDGGIAPFKMAYICFKARDPQAEAIAHAPSGGGWHEIGDPAETVINSLESAPVIFGYANGVPAAKTPDGDFDHGLTDVAVIRRLQPGYAIVTAAGTTSFQEQLDNKNNHTNLRGQGTASGRNYHWFIFDQPNEVCGFEWVHKCVPTATNQMGMNC